jgi:methionine-rich copper-binding protein CopC
MRTLKTTLAAVGLLCSMSTLAHTHLVRSTPADGADLTAPPPEAVLVFAEPVTVATAKIESSDGTKSALTTPAGANAEIHLKLPMLAAGRYRVSWRAASADGHVMTGQLTFTVEGQPAH